ncbi:MAG TPA: hypothetical protein VEG34_14550, partial [Thermoanaerobaculia bacterium]|nr:hypothetical protein [Thermoanaerobaculia bacterium]
MDRPKEKVPVASDDIFDLGDVRRQSAEDVFSLEAPAAPPASEPEEVVEVVEASDGDLFPGLVSRSTRERYLASLASEGIFEVGLAPVVPAEVPVPAEPPGPEPHVEDASWLEEIPVVPLVPEELAPPVFEDLAPIPPPAPPAEEPAEDLWADEPVQPAEPVATATLGEIYLRQGHADEAERIFLEVLEREPGNGAALAGLERIGEKRHAVPQSMTLDAGRLLAGFRPGGGGTTARKVFLLNRYLDRIRGSRNVP